MHYTNQFDQATKKERIATAREACIKHLGEREYDILIRHVKLFWILAGEDNIRVVHRYRNHIQSLHFYGIYGRYSARAILEDALKCNIGNE